MKLFFDDENFDGQLQRSVGKADAGMANVGECLAIAAQITGGDRDSWYRAWSAFGLRLVEQADAALAAGHRVSARGAYLRATEYLRQAFFFHRENLDGNELRLAYAASVAAFHNALPLLNHQAKVLTGVLTGYLFTPAGASGPLPTLLHVDGYDGSAEELYASVYPALERGYAFAAVDGPGQGGVLYERRIPMRPDWENVVPEMVDPVFQGMLDNPTMATLLGPRMVTNGTPTVRAYFTDMTRYHNRDAAPKITCPTYVTDNETDQVSTGQGQVLYDHLECPKEFRRFTVAEGAAGHCEGMAPIVFWTAALNWLDDRLAKS
jgi:hypothetical protein